MGKMQTTLVMVGKKRRPECKTHRQASNWKKHTLLTKSWSPKSNESKLQNIESKYTKTATKGNKTESFFCISLVLWKIRMKYSSNQRSVWNTGRNKKDMRMKETRDRPIWIFRADAETDFFSLALADDQYGLPIFLSRYLEPILLLLL